MALIPAPILMTLPLMNHQTRIQQCLSNHQLRISLKVTGDFAKA